MISEVKLLEGRGVTAQQGKRKPCAATKYFQSHWFLGRVTNPIIYKMQNIGKSAITVETIILFLSLGLVCDQVSAFLTNQVELSPGTFITGVQLKDYDAFYGVPFARPPVGNLRFRVIKQLTHLVPHG